MQSEGYEALPDNVKYISSEEGDSGVSLINKDNTSDKEHSDLHLLINLVLTAAFIISIGICIYINYTVLDPFEKLSDYPEKLSKNEISEKLPETKNRLFGRFIWGINMLSDKSGICRILSQNMDNALKYENGEGITVDLNKKEEGFYFIIKNKGEVPAEKELPYIFNSFWRGSNAGNISGNGIGLFEAREIVMGLDGDIYVRADAEAKEMEFDIYIP